MGPHCDSYCVSTSDPQRFPGACSGATRSRANNLASPNNSDDGSAAEAPKGRRPPWLSALPGVGYGAEASNSHRYARDSTS